MATPDVSALTSSSQIFSSNTLPQVRAIHKALHAQIDDKAVRLRTQVGGSYRELLGTADTIVRMSGTMAAAQTTLGTMGGRCGRGVVGGKVAGLARFVRDAEAERLHGGSELGVLVRVKLLGACALVVGRTLGAGSPAVADGEAAARAHASGPLGRGDRLVLAARVLVLSRLLVKSFGDSDAPPGVSKPVEEAKARLRRLRARLLRSIDKMLDGSSAGIRQDDILRALSAYSLVTNSGAQDVLRHFLHMRGDAMVLSFEVEERERERQPDDVVRCMQLYTNTILTVQSMTPHRLTEALLGLKKTALLADESLRQVEALRLDVYERWCGDEIQYFTPFIRHDDLHAPQAREMLGKWAGEGGDILLQGLDKTLERITEFKATVDLRTTVLKVWIGDGGRARGFDSSIMMKRLRDVINKHMLAVVDDKVNKLRLVGSEVAAALDTWQEESDPSAPPGLWDLDSIDTDLGSGASQFSQDVVARLYGRNDAVSRAGNSYRSWRHIVDEVSEAVAQLRRLRWDNDVEEIEDEEVIEQRQALLSKTDPHLLQDHLDTSLVGAFKSLEHHLAALRDGTREKAGAGQAAMYFARLLRDIRAGLPQLDGVRGFGLQLVPSLHEQIVTSVAESALSDFSNTALRTTRVVGRSLWEGEPELPNTPSSGTFRFLRDLVTSMADAGTDLWSPHAVAKLKQHVADYLGHAWLPALDGFLDKTAASSSAVVEDPDPDPDPVVPPSGTPETADSGEAAEHAEAKQEATTEDVPTDDTEAEQKQSKDLVVQWLFDLYYLRCSLQASSHQATEGLLAHLETRLCEAIGSQLETGTFQPRLSKSAQDYWKRTSLLFGLLA